MGLEGNAALRTKSRVYRVGISGSYGGLNLGDEAILEAIVAQLRQSLPVEITVFSRNAEDTLRHQDVDRAVPVRDLSWNEARDEVARLDVLVLGGGGILFDREVEIYLREVQLANELGIPVMVYAISAGPLKHASARALVRETLARAAVITVRDRQGRQLLEEVGLRRSILVTADPAFLVQPLPIPPDMLAREGFSENRLVGFSVREPGPAAPDMDVEHYHRLLANAADFMVDRFGSEVVFVPMERERMDIQHSHAVVSQMQCANRATILKGSYRPGQLLSLLGHFEFAVGMRLHFLIFAGRQGVPFVALPYASKITGLLQDLDMEMPPLEDVNTGRLLATIDRSWDMRLDIRQRIQEKIPILQQRARENNQYLVDLLKSLRPRARSQGIGPGPERGRIHAGTDKT